jgi:hypothetical protein
MLTRCVVALLLLTLVPHNFAVAQGGQPATARTDVPVRTVMLYSSGVDTSSTQAACAATVRRSSPGHSARMAIIGSTRAARVAGHRLAPSPTARITAGVSTNVVGSTGAMP